MKELKAQGSKIPVLALSVDSREYYENTAIEAGASGYLSKESDPETIIAAIRACAQKTDMN
ncbi:MAG: response regulator [Nitrospirota bacterium]